MIDDPSDPHGERIFVWDNFASEACCATFHHDRKSAIRCAIRKWPGCFEISANGFAQKDNRQTTIHHILVPLPLHGGIML